MITQIINQNISDESGGKENRALNEKLKTQRGILTLLIVFLSAAAILTFPYAFNLTWALPGAESDRTLTYTSGKLTWDSDADIDEEGAVILPVFKSAYENAKSKDGKNIVAPGTSNETGIRLLTASNNEIRYTAVLYRLDDTEIPIVSGLAGGEEAEAEVLPENVTQDMVEACISGTISKNSVKTLDISWEWAWSDTESDNIFDTSLGVKENPDEVEYGLYVVVQDDSIPDEDDSDADSDDKKDDSNNDNTNGKTISPTTGDTSNMLLWFIIAACALAVVIVVFIISSKRKKEDK